MEHTVQPTSPDPKELKKKKKDLPIYTHIRVFLLLLLLLLFFFFFFSEKIPEWQMLIQSLLTTEKVPH